MTSSRNRAASSPSRLLRRQQRPRWLIGFTGSMAESSEDPAASAHLAGDEDAVWQGLTTLMGPARSGSPSVSVASMTSPSV